MTKQEENWEMMVFLNFSWKEADEVEGEDRGFLLEKAEETKFNVLTQKKEMAEQQEQHRQRMAAASQQQQHPSYAPMGMPPQGMMPPQGWQPPTPQPQEIPQDNGAEVAKE